MSFNARRLQPSKRAMLEAIQQPLEKRCPSRQRDDRMNADHAIFSAWRAEACQPALQEARMDFADGVDAGVQPASRQGRLKRVIAQEGRHGRKQNTRLADDDIAPGKAGETSLFGRHEIIIAFGIAWKTDVPLAPLDVFKTIADRHLQIDMKDCSRADR